MRRASEDTLKQRTILKASKPSPQKGMTRATEDVLKQRKVVRAKRSSFGTPPRTGNQGSTPGTPNSARQNASPTPSTPAPTPPQEQTRSSSSGSTPTPTKSNDDEEVFLEMRAKLFERVNSAWANTGTGTLRCFRTAKKQGIKLESEKGQTILHLEVGALLQLTKITKETKKGKATYVKYSAVVDKTKGEEKFLLQVKPELLEKIYSAMTLIFR